MIDSYTYGRLARDGEPRESVRRLAFELVERGLTGAPDGRDVVAASNDGLSVTCEGGGEKKRRAWALANDYLASEVDAAGVPLLYCGSFA
jgi:hypothetical protein